MSGYSDEEDEGYADEGYADEGCGDEGAGDEAALVAAMGRIYAGPSDVETLLQKGVDVNFVDSKGHSALMVAAFMGFDECVQLLLEAKADPALKATAGNWTGRARLRYLWRKETETANLEGMIQSLQCCLPMKPRTLFPWLFTARAREE